MLRVTPTTAAAPDLLSQLRHALPIDRGAHGRAPRPADFGIQNCTRPQELQAVPFHQPALLLVMAGRKEIVMSTHTVVARAGELLLIPPDSTVWLGKYPDGPANDYQGLGVRFTPPALSHFRQIYGAQLDAWDIAPRWQARAPDSVVATLLQWLEWRRQYPQDRQLEQHRQVELLLLLARQGLAGNILLGEHPNWRQRVLQLVSMDPARNWQMRHVCAKLAVSESSLRRHLRDENSSFREILEEMRLAAGLTLLQETFWSIGRVAEAVGYQSQSRFGERFKTRFGVTPSELRRTHAGDSGETLAVDG